MARRKDAYPEDTDYYDTGCVLHPSCLSCPREICKLEDSTYNYHDEVRKHLHTRCLELQRQGYEAKTIAQILGTSTRTVYRYLRKAKNASHAT